MKSFDNIVSTMTGASLEVLSTGSNVRLIIQGEPSQVAHAVTLLYNYHAIGEWPAGYESEEQAVYDYINLRVSKRGFVRGYVALVFTQLTNSECAKAIVKTAHELRQWLGNQKPIVIELA